MAIALSVFSLVIGWFLRYVVKPNLERFLAAT
jgi:hypothetical protein